MSKHYTRTLISSGVFILIFIALGFQGCNRYTGDEESFFLNKDYLPTKNLSESILVPTERPSLDYFPCNDCHSELVVNTNRRELVEMHDDIFFDHDSESRWCLACHDANNRDSLRLANGRLLSFEDSYLLCGQCHGPKLRDWRMGIHGKRTGEWNGEKQYLLCVHCHNPHAPRFQLLEPMPPPLKPTEIRLDSTKRNSDGE